MVRKLATIRLFPVSVTWDKEPDTHSAIVWS